jgi:predicted RNA-binding Zn ribbon-like protein
MTESRPAPIFIADALGLDFLNSIATPVDKPVEWLANGEDLIAWLEQAKLIPPHTADAFKLTAIPGELDTIAAQARALREWFRGFVQTHIGRPLTGAAVDELAPLNHILAREEEYGQIVASDHSHEGAHHLPSSPLVWQPLRRWRSPEALLLPIARAIADLVCHENFSHVRACEGPACTLLFIDRSKGNKRRRWCSMAVCGNRAKAQAHRARKRQTSSF